LGWAWVLGIIVSIVEHPATHAYGILGTIVAVIVIYYLTRPHAKVFFGRDGKPSFLDIPQDILHIFLGSYEGEPNSTIACEKDLISSH
jgi:hypothetical protein